MWNIIFSWSWVFRFRLLSMEQHKIQFKLFRAFFNFLWIFFIIFLEGFLAASTLRFFPLIRFHDLMVYQKVFLLSHHLFHISWSVAPWSMFYTTNVVGSSSAHLKLKQNGEASNVNKKKVDTTSFEQFSSFGVSRVSRSKKSF